METFFITHEWNIKQTNTNGARVHMATVKRHEAVSSGVCNGSPLLLGEVDKDYIELG